MKILHVTRQFYPAIGGIETAVYHLARGMPAKGVQADVLTINRLWGSNKRLPSSENIDGINVIRIPFFGSRRYAIAAKTISHIQDYDIIHLHSSDFFLDYLSLTRIFHRKPIILISHGLIFHTNTARIFKRIYFSTITHLSLRNVSSIVCVSQHDLLKLSAIVPTEKLTLIPNGIDEGKFISDDDKRDPTLIISVGRLARNKRYDKLLKAFARVLTSRPDAQWCLIGPDDGELITLQKLATQLVKSERTNFLGKLTNEKLTEYLTRANIWVSTSGYESFGIGLLEAIASLQIWFRKCIAEVLRRKWLILSCFLLGTMMRMGRWRRR